MDNWHYIGDLHTLSFQQVRSMADLGTALEILIRRKQD